MAGQLQGKKIAIMATDGFEEVELTQPMQALKEAGAEVEIVAPEAGEIQGFNHLQPSQKIKVDRALTDVEAGDYDALMLPGGVANPDQLRINQAATHFVRSFAEAGKPIGAICHAPWILINAGLAEGRTLTCWPTIRQDLRNAGAHVVDQEVVVDSGLVTSRGPKDLPAFCSKIIEEFREGRHEGQARAANLAPDPVRPGA
jgi:protease I